MEDIDQAMEMFRTGEEEDRLQALKLLGRQQGGEPLKWVFAALGDVSWRIRKEATEIFLSLPGAPVLCGEVIELLHSQDNAGLRNAAVEILVRLGRASVPGLLEEVTCSDHDVRKFALDILGEIGEISTVPAMINSLRDDDSNVRAAAAENLGKMKAAEAVPALLEAMEKPDLCFRFTVLEALGQIAAGVPVHRLLAFSDERLLRKALFDCLGRIGGEEAVPALVEGLADPMRNVREAAATALVAIAKEHLQSVVRELSALAGSRTGEQVASLLDHNSLPLRHAGIMLLGWTGDRRFAPRLLALLDEEELRDKAARSIVSMGPTAVCSLASLWESGEGRTRTYLAYLFGEAECHETIPLLERALRSEDPELKMVSAQALGKIGDVGAIAGLVACLEKGQGQVRDVVRQALSWLGRRFHAETVEALCPLLEDEDPEIRMSVVRVLGELGGGQVCRHLSFAMKDESPLVRRAAVRALDGQADEEMLTPLMLALTDEDTEVRQLAAEALGGSGHREGLQALELALRDEDLWVRSAAVRAIGRLGGTEAVPLLEAAVNDPVGLVCIAALEGLSMLDEERAYPHLLRLLDHEDEEVVVVALNNLAGRGTAEWVDGVKDRLLNHAHWDVRVNFARILASSQGERCRPDLEGRLLVEGEDLVRQQLVDLIEQLGDFGG